MRHGAAELASSFSRGVGWEALGKNTVVNMSCGGAMTTMTLSNKGQESQDSFLRTIFMCRVCRSAANVGLCARGVCGSVQ